MAKKRKRNRNPLLEKKFQEGYQLGKSHGVKQALDFFIDKFEGLEDVPGIGDRTMERIKEQLGHEYFK